jgi:hypothetical protein
LVEDAAVVALLSPVAQFDAAEGQKSKKEGRSQN